MNDLSLRHLTFQAATVMNHYQMRMTSVQQILNANSVSAYLKVICQLFVSFDHFINSSECDCDPNAANPDSFCPFNQFCKQCKCLQEGNYANDF